MRACVYVRERNNSSKASCADCNYQSCIGYWTLCIMAFGVVIIILAMADSNVKWHSNKKRSVTIEHHQANIPPSAQSHQLTANTSGQIHRHVNVWEHNACRHPLRTRWSSAVTTSPPNPALGRPRTAAQCTHVRKSSTEINTTVHKTVLMCNPTHSFADCLNICVSINQSWFYQR